MRNALAQPINLLPNSDLQCFIVPGAFSPAACLALLTPEVQANFQTAHAHYPTYYRNNDRLVVDDAVLAGQLLEAIRPVLPAQLPADAPGGAPWQLKALNTRLRFCRYAAGQYFHRHLDGVYHQSDTVQSRLTFMIYLNDAAEFTGGRTLFYRSKDDPEIWAEYLPVQGDLIVFDHRIWHEGEQLSAGQKFVLRSDILYETALQPAAPHEPFAAGHLGYIWQVVPFGEGVVSAGRDTTIKVWNRAGQCQQQLRGHRNSVLSLCALTETILLSASRDATVKVWEQADGQLHLVRTLAALHAATVLAVVRLTDTRFASSAADGLIQVGDLDGRVRHTLASHTDWVWQLLPLPQQQLLSASEDGTLRLWDWQAGTCLGTIASQQPPAHALLHEPAQGLVLCSTYAGTIQVWQTHPDAGQWALLATLAAHQGIVRALTWLDGGRFASGGEDNQVKIWNLATRTCEQTMSHTDFVQSLAWLPASRQLISASYDGQLKAWEVPTVWSTTPHPLSKKEGELVSNSRARF